MARKRRSRRRNSLAGDLISRLTRAVIAIAVLTAFVLAIAYGVKTLSSVNGKDLAGFASPYLARFGLEEERIGEVAGSVFEMIGDLDIEGINTSNADSGDEEGTEDKKTDSASEEKEVKKSVSERLAPEGEVVTSLAILADSHIANDDQKYIDNKTHLRRALAQAAEKNVAKVIHVGDITNFGVLADLREAKDIFDEAEVDYLALPGDRDLAAAVGSDNFIKVFGDNKGAFELEGQKVVLFDNSANYTLIPQENIDWFKKEIEDADFVIFSQPLFADGLVLFNYLYMGSTDDVPNESGLADKQAAVLQQRDELLRLVRESDVKAVIAGDHHYSSNLVDAERGSLEHFVAGAVSGTIGASSQSILQAQRFLILDIYENGAYVIEDEILQTLPN